MAFINKLHPVTYQLDVVGLNTLQGIPDSTQKETHFAAGVQHKEQIVEAGFIAQEVEEVAKSINYHFSGIIPPANEKSTYAISYAEFVPSIAKSIQELKRIIDEQKRIYQQQIDELKAEIKILKQANLPTKASVVASLLVYPNPTNGQSTVQIPGIGKKELVICNTLGNQLSRMWVTGGNTQQINTQNWSKGFYPIVILENKQLVAVGNLVKE